MSTRKFKEPEFKKSKIEKIANLKAKSKTIIKEKYESDSDQSPDSEEYEIKRKPKKTKSKTIKQENVVKEPKKKMSLKKHNTTWTDHVKKYVEKHGCTYKEALTQARSTYKKK